MLLSHSTRGDIISTTKSANTKILFNTFSSKGKEVWNNMPVQIRNSSSINTFKRLYKEHLLRTQTLSFK